MTQEQILALPGHRHVKMWLLHKQLGLSRKEIAQALGGTNPGAVGNELKKYEKDKMRQKEAEEIESGDWNAFTSKKPVKNKVVVAPPTPESTAKEKKVAVDPAPKKPIPSRKKTIKDIVIDNKDILKTLTTHTQLREWAIKQGFDNRAAFPKFKLALNEIGMDYDQLKTGIHKKNADELNKSITHQVTLYSDAKASAGRFGITDVDGDVLWYGKFFNEDADEQSDAELAAAKKAVWLASKVKEAIGAQSIALTLFVDAQWLTYQTHGGQKGYALTMLARKHNIKLNVKWIPGSENPADKWTTASGFKKWSDNDLPALAKPYIKDNTEEDLDVDEAGAGTKVDGKPNPSAAGDGLLVGVKHTPQGAGIEVKTPEGKIKVEGGEIIMSAPASEQHCETLSKWNEAAGGVTFPCDHPANDGIRGPMRNSGVAGDGIQVANWQDEGIATVAVAAAKFGWTAIQLPDGFELFNRNGKKCADIKFKRHQYFIYNQVGEPILSGHGQLGTSVEKVIEKYFYGKREAGDGLQVGSTDDVDRTYYEEAERYIDNAKTSLKNAGITDDGKYYSDVKYVKSAAGIAYAGAEQAAKWLIQLRGIQIKGAKIEHVKEALGKIDKGVLKILNSVYQSLHIAIYYGGEKKKVIVDSAIESAQELIAYLRPYKKSAQYGAGTKLPAALPKRMFINLSSSPADRSRIDQLSRNAQLEELSKPDGTVYVEVSSLKEASAMVRRFCDTYGLGASNWSGGEVVEEKFNPIAWVTYNGRVWNHPWDKTAEEINVDSPELAGKGRKTGDNTTNSQDNTNNSQKTTKHEIDNLISGKGEVRSGTLIQAAAGYLRTSTGTSTVVKRQEQEQIKGQQANLLRKYSIENNLWIPEVSFENFIGKGTEQDVYLLDEKTVVKANYGIFYDTWLDYLNSLLLHNLFFPDTTYELIGFGKYNGYLVAVVKQPFIESTAETDLNDVEKFMEWNGFRKVKENYYENQELGIVLRDLHDENVLTKNGILYFIDTFFHPIPIADDGTKVGDGDDIETLRGDLDRANTHYNRLRGDGNFEHSASVRAVKKKMAGLRAKIVEWHENNKPVGDRTKVPVAEFVLAPKTEKAYFLLTRNEVVTERDRLAAIHNRTEDEGQRWRDLCRTSLVRFKTLLVNLTAEVEATPNKTKLAR